MDGPLMPQPTVEPHLTDIEEAVELTRAQVRWLFHQPAELIETLAASPEALAAALPPGLTLPTRQQLRIFAAIRAYLEPDFSTVAEISRRNQELEGQMERALQFVTLFGHLASHWHDQAAVMVERTITSLHHALERELIHAYAAAAYGCTPETLEKDHGLQRTVAADWRRIGRLMLLGDLLGLSPGQIEADVRIARLLAQLETAIKERIRPVSHWLSGAPYPIRRRIRRVDDDGEFFIRARP